MPLYTSIPPVESSGSGSAQDQVGTNHQTNSANFSADGPGGEIQNRWFSRLIQNPFVVVDGARESWGAWVRYETTSTGDFFAFYLPWSNAGGFQEISVVAQNDGFVELRTRIDGVYEPASQFADVGTELRDQNWHHVYFELIDNAQIRLMLDGGLLLDQTVSQAFEDLTDGTFTTDIPSRSSDTSGAGLRVYDGIAGEGWRDFRRAMPVGDSTGTVTGTVEIGQTLTYNPPTYSDGSVFVGYQWYRDTGSDYQGQLILSATSATYTVSGDDAGFKLYCREIRSNNAFDGRSATWTGFWPSEYTTSVPLPPQELPPMYAEATAQFSPTAAISQWSFLINLANLQGTGWWGDVTSSDGSRGRASLSDGTQVPVHFIDFNSGAETGWARVFYNPVFSTPQTIRIHPPRSDISSEGPSDLRGQYAAYDSNWYAYYPAGATPTDATRNGLDMTTTGTVSVIAGKVAAGYSNADGGNNFAEVTAGVALNNQAITLMGWIRPNASLSGNGDPYGAYVGTGGAARILPLARNTQNDWRVQHRVGSNNINIDLATRGSGSWVHLAQSYGGSPLNVAYRAGTAEGNNAGTRADTTFDALRLLARATTSINFYGDVSDVQFHSAARSDAWVNYEWRQSDNNAAFWGTWTYFPGVSYVDMAVGWTANATMSADLDVSTPAPTDLATDWDATAVLNADLDVVTPLPTDLATAWSAVATLNAALDVVTPLPTDLAVAWSAIATLNADLDVQAPGFTDLATAWSATAILAADLDVVTPLPTDLATAWDATATLDASLGIARGVEVAWDATATLNANIDVQTPGFANLDVMWSAVATLTADLDVLSPGFQDLATAWDAVATLTADLEVPVDLATAWDATAVLAADLDVVTAGFTDLATAWDAVATLTADLDVVSQLPTDLATSWDATAALTANLDVEAPGSIGLDVSWTSVAIADMAVEIARGLAADWDATAVGTMAISIARGVATDWGATATLNADLEIEAPLTVDLAVDWTASATMAAAMDVDLSLAVAWDATAVGSFGLAVDFAMAVQWQAVALMDAPLLVAPLEIGPTYYGVCIPQRPVCAMELLSDERRMHLPTTGDSQTALPRMADTQVCIAQRQLDDQGVEIPNADRRFHLPSLGDPGIDIPRKKDVDCLR